MKPPVSHHMTNSVMGEGECADGHLTPTQSWGCTWGRSPLTQESRMNRQPERNVLADAEGC